MHGAPDGRIDLDTLARALGSPELWPGGLKAMASFLVAAHQPMALWWGEERAAVFNTPWSKLMGPDAPARLGETGAGALPRDWRDMDARIKAVMTGEPGVWLYDQRLTPERADKTETMFFTISLNPIRDEDGAVEGVIAVCCETTEAVVGARRLRLLDRLAGALAGADSPDNACAAAQEAFGEDREDLPVTAIYLFDHSARTAILAAGDADLLAGAPSPDKAYERLTAADWESEARRLILRGGSGSPHGALLVARPETVREDDGHDRFLTAIRDALGKALSASHLSRTRQAAISAFRHRIQNNLQAVSALLTLSRTHGDTGQALSGLDVMHDRLSQLGAGQIALSSLDPEHVSADVFLPRLKHELRAVFPNARLELIEPVEPVALPDPRAGALAFIIGESARMIEAGGGGEAAVSLKPAPGGGLRLAVGYGQALEGRERASLSEIIGLFAKQLRGTLTIEEGENGPVFAVDFARPAR